MYAYTAAVQNFKRHRRPFDEIKRKTMSDDDDEYLHAVLEAEERKFLADNSRRTIPQQQAYDSTPNTAGTYRRESSCAEGTVEIYRS